jgi:superkiller protein 3
MRRSFAVLAAILMLLVALPNAQSPAERASARRQSQVGWELMKAEQFEEAAKAFQAAIDLDPEFEFAYYGLGRADMALKRFVRAVAAYSKCRDLYEARAGQQFSNVQDAQRFRQNRLTEIDEVVRQLQSGPQTAQVQEQLRQLQESRRQIQEYITRGNDVSIVESTVPAWVSLALGSAYFRSGQLAAAEREYKAAIAVDSRAGEAHSNLAVVYLETGRIAEADAALRAAKKAGFRVDPQLEQAIKDRIKN